MYEQFFENVIVLNIFETILLLRIDKIFFTDQLLTVRLNKNIKSQNSRK